MKFLISVLHFPQLAWPGFAGKNVTRLLGASEYSILLKLHFSLLLKVLRDVLYTNGLWRKSATYIDNVNAQTIFAVPTFQRARG